MTAVFFIHAGTNFPARMATLIMRETAAVVVISRFFVMAVKKGKMIADGEEDLIVNDQIFLT
jgi:hypothetical protein